MGRCGRPFHSKQQLRCVIDYTHKTFCAPHTLDEGRLARDTSTRMPQRISCEHEARASGGVRRLAGLMRRS